MVKVIIDKSLSFYKKILKWENHNYVIFRVQKSKKLQNDPLAHPTI